MPSKSHRAASRQAQLRGKSRRGKPNVQAFDAGPAEGEAPASANAAAIDEAARPRPTAAAVRSQPQRASQQLRRARQGAAAATSPAYGYLGRELRQIAITTSVILVILVALTFVLRS